MLKMLFKCSALVVGSVLLGLAVRGGLCVHAAESVTISRQESLGDLQVGWVGSVSGSEVVINDMGSSLDSITLYDPKGFLLDNRSLTAGQYVAFRRDENGMEIRLLDAAAKRSFSSSRSQQDRVTKPNEDVIRQIDGVWKN